MRKRPLVLIACVFLAGLSYQRYAVAGLAVIGMLLIFQELWFGKKTKEFKKAAGRSLILLSAFLIGIFHMQNEELFRDAYMSKIKDGDLVTVWGEFINVETTEYGIRGLLSNCYIGLEGENIPCNDILVYTSNDQIQIGQIHKIIGKVNMFSEARNEGNFDASIYYQSLKVDFALKEESSVCLRETLDDVKTVLYSVKEKVFSVYESCMEEKSAGFYQAMVLGDKVNLDENLKDLFLIGGISHILAISGLHISILGRGLYRILRRFGVGFKIAGVVGGIVIVLYCIMVGGSVSTIRAVGMLLLFFIAQWMGRSYDMLNALGAMVIALLWENPFLLENSGFWFSVLALVGIGFVGKGSFGITLMTLPLTAFVYYEIPLYATIVNLIVLPLLTPVFALAVFGGIVGVISLGGAKWILLPCEWLLSFYEGVCKLVSYLPGASIICGKPQWWQMLLYYSVLLGGVLWLQSSFCEKKKVRNGSLVVILLLCIVCIFFPKEKRFEISFLDVGQGDGIYISTGDGSAYFIDGGSSNIDGVGTSRILPFLKSRGIRTIDYWFVSHCDTDHMSGLLEIMESGYRIRYLVVAKNGENNEKYEQLLEVAKKAGISVLKMDVGHQIRTKHTTVRCLGPDSLQSASLDGNDASLILQLEYTKERGTVFKALFAGDISSKIEEKLCESGVLTDIDLLKANHHGSNYSNSALLLETVCPEYVVISCSKKNRYGHPGTDALQRMEDVNAKIFCTMDGGQITLPLLQ